MDKMREDGDCRNARFVLKLAACMWLDRIMNMQTTLTLDESHFKTVWDKARERGQSPEQYVQALIDADAVSFDEILKPIRDGFDGVADTELDDLFARAQIEARKKLDRS